MDAQWIIVIGAHSADNPLFVNIVTKMDFQNIVMVNIRGWGTILIKSSINKYISQ